jgi:undecaprenyl-diphosphatase
MNFWEAILYGLVQGITEFLPLSSSGHLALLGRILGTDKDVMFSLASLMHVGTLISIFAVMWREIGGIFRDIFGAKTWQIILASIPALLAVILLGDWLDSLFAGGYLGISFLISAMILTVSQLLIHEKKANKDVGYKESLIAGIGQAIAVAPGISRSGTTICALQLSGVEREKAIRFSFLMAIPAILGGFAKDMLDMVKGEGSALLAPGAFNVVIGVLVAAISGYFAMRFMIRKLRRKGFLVCAIYVAALGALILIDQSVTHLVF